MGASLMDRHLEGVVDNEAGNEPCYQQHDKQWHDYGRDHLVYRVGALPFKGKQSGVLPERKSVGIIEFRIVVMSQSGEELLEGFVVFTAVYEAELQSVRIPALEVVTVGVFLLYH